MTQADLTYKINKSEWIWGGGSFTQTFDKNQILPAYANTVINLFNVNLTQLYLDQGSFLAYQSDKNQAYSFSGEIKYAQRSRLNNIDPPTFNWSKREPNSNLPNNLEPDNVGFEPHKAMTFSGGVILNPGARYRLINGKKMFAGSSWPSIELNYKKGMADVNFDFLSFGLNQDVKSGSQEYLKYRFETGTFINAKKVYLMDMRHINSPDMENGLPGMFAFYRMLNTQLPIQISPENYYLYSTKGPYVKFHAINEFPKLLVSLSPLARFAGIKEDLFFNYLSTPALPNYFELGYGIDGIARLFRIELLGSYNGVGKINWGWQLGVTL